MLRVPERNKDLGIRFVSILENGRPIEENPGGRLAKRLSPLAKNTLCVVVRPSLEFNVFAVDRTHVRIPLEGRELPNRTLIYERPIRINGSDTVDSMIELARVSAIGIFHLARFDIRRLPQDGFALREFYLRAQICRNEAGKTICPQLENEPEILTLALESLQGTEWLRPIRDSTVKVAAE